MKYIEAPHITISFRNKDVLNIYVLPNTFTIYIYIIKRANNIKRFSRIRHLKRKCSVLSIAHRVFCFFDSTSVLCLPKGERGNPKLFLRTKNDDNKVTL